ncbi:MULTISPECIES: hypothetical protein [Bacillaceae]|uniref:hypothetical protein n=1 Tax=Bacillaceae TaxID=186817 RepID=UPI00069E5B4C|nr:MULTISPECIES: hypothetical protein [Bacillaceae]
MIPLEVENRIARYFLHRYLPDEVQQALEEKLLPSCIWNDEEDIDEEELVRWAIEIIDKELRDKRFK